MDAKAKPVAGRNPEVPDFERFPTTRWTLVARAADGGGDGPEARREALGVVLHRYLPALRAHLLARRIAPDRADDLIQSFVADKVIERDLLAHADKRRGRFRSFLCAALDHFAANRLRFDLAERRAPKGAKVFALAEGIEPASPPDGPGGPDAFDVAWARGALAEALRRMQHECLACGRGDLWDVFDARVLAPALGDACPAAYGELVRRLGYPTPKVAANALVTAKRRFEQALRGVLAEYVDNERELERELAGLGRVLASAGAREASARDVRGVAPGGVHSGSISPGDIAGLAAERALSRIWPRTGGAQGDGAAGDGTPCAASLPWGAADEAVWRPDELGEVLAHQLAAPLQAPLGYLAEDAVDAPTGGAQTPFGRVLNDPAPLPGRAELLRRVKDWAKPHMRGGSGGDVPGEVAAVIYFAALCGALARCGQRITGLTDAAVAEGARWALARAWTDQATASTLRDGLACLADREACSAADGAAGEHVAERPKE